MSYHPIIGITIFIIAIFVSFILGRIYLKKKLNLLSSTENKNKGVIPKGEVTSPDAPWLDNE